MPRSFFPPRSLRQSLIIPSTILERAGGKPMFRLTLAEELKTRAESDSFRELITASSGFGLTAGSREAEKIELLPRGEQLAQGSVDAAIEALFSIEVFQHFYEHFGNGRAVPSEQVIRDFLTTDERIPERQVQAVITGIIENARDWYLIQTIGGGERIVPIDIAKNKARSSAEDDSRDVFQSPDSAPQKAPSAPPSRTNGSTRIELSPGLQLNIAIHIAADTPDEKIEVFFKNMRKYLLTDEQ